MTKQQIHFEGFGYEPGRMKPVHFATGYFLALTGHYYRLELLNKVAVISHKEGLKGDYEPATLRELLLTGPRPQISSRVGIPELNRLRSQINAAVANDNAVYAAYGDYSAFGNDYTLSSATMLTDQKRLDGYSGWLVRQVLDQSVEGREVLEFSRRWIEQEGDTLQLFVKPLIDAPEDQQERASDYATKFGMLPEDRLDAIAVQMTKVTHAVALICRTIDSRESHHLRLRSLIIALGMWLLLYQIREAAAASGVPPNSLLFCDFTGDSGSRCRGASRTCFSKHRELVFRAYEAWHEAGRITNLDEFRNKKTQEFDFKFLEQHFSDLAVRIGLAQPRAMQVKTKHYELQPDTLRVVVGSVLGNNGMMPLPELARRLRDIWQISLGGCDDDLEQLRENGYHGLDEDDDLRWNRDAFISQLKRLGLAYEPSDGLVLCGLDSELLL